jgi:hypothetical protein
VASTVACDQAGMPAVPEPPPANSGEDFALVAPNGVEVVGVTQPHGLQGMAATRYKLYRGPGFELQTRYGPAPSQPAIHELFVAPKRPGDTVVEVTAKIDTRVATIRRWRRGPPHPAIELDVHAPGSTREHDFSAIARCETAAACAQAEALVRSIHFLR